MIFNVSDIDRPIFKPEMGLKWHLLAHTRGSAFGRRQSVELAIESEQPSARGLGEMDADLFQSGTHAVRAKLRAFHHQLSHFMDFPDPRFARVLLRRIVEARMAEPRPALEHFIHPMARRLQIGADGGM